MILKHKINKKTYKHHDFKFLFSLLFPSYNLFFHSLMKAIWPYLLNLHYFIPISDGDCVQIAARIKDKYNVNEALIGPFRPSLPSIFFFYRWFMRPFGARTTNDKQCLIDSHCCIRNGLDACIVRWVIKNIS